MSMCEARFSRQYNGPLAESTVRGTISYTSLSFRDNDRANPTKNEDGELETWSNDHVKPITAGKTESERS